MRDFFLKLPFVYSSEVRQQMSPERHYGSAVVTLSFLCTAVALRLVSVVSQAKRFFCFWFFLSEVRVEGQVGDHECELCHRSRRGRLFRVSSRLRVEASSWRPSSTKHYHTHPRVL